MKRRVADKNKSNLPTPASLQESVNTQGLTNTQGPTNTQEAANAQEIASTQEQASAQQPAKCHFFRLPTELRIKIYEFAFCDFQPPPTKLHEYFDARIASPPLIQTCRLIRKEAIGFYCNRLRELTHEIQQAFVFGLVGVYDHYDALRRYFDRQEWEEFVDFANALQTRDEAMTLMNEYLVKFKRGVGNRIFDLVHQRYWIGDCRYEEMCRESEGKVLRVQDMLDLTEWISV